MSVIFRLQTSCCLHDSTSSTARDSFYFYYFFGCVCGLHFNLCDNSWTTLDRAAGFDEAFFQENSLANIKRDTIYPNPYSTVTLACIDFVFFAFRWMNDNIFAAFALKKTFAVSVKPKKESVHTAGLHYTCHVSPDPSSIAIYRSSI
jgi:hypothetical protein